MNHEEHQAELLDAYLDALQHNPDAAIPDGLEADMADFAKILVAQPIVAEDKGSTQSRVWQQINNSPEILPFNTKQDEFQEMNPRMRQLFEKQKRSEKGSGWFPMAAAAVVAVVIGLVLVTALYRNDEPQQGSLIQEPVMVVTATPLPSTFTPTPVPTIIPPDGFSATQAENARTTAETMATMLDTPTPIPTSTPFEMQPTIVPPDTLVCEFENDLLLRLNTNQPGSRDVLIVSAAARTPGTTRLVIEIFGGRLTNDAYVPLIEMDNPSDTEQELVIIQGDAYTTGSYLLQLRLVDTRGETLSSCALPVTFTGQ